MRKKGERIGEVHDTLNVVCTPDNPLAAIGVELILQAELPERTSPKFYAFYRFMNFRGAKVREAEASSV